MQVPAGVRRFSPPCALLVLSFSFCVAAVLFFFCCQHGQPNPDLHTPLKSSTLANIRVAFGPSLSRELVELKCSEAEDELLDKRPPAGQEEEEDFGKRETDRERLCGSFDKLVRCIDRPPLPQTEKLARPSSDCYFSPACHAWLLCARWIVFERFGGLGSAAKR